MSFLNPVNEPVLRFSSTNAGAPQINYNTRTAGDIKAVLKACLVTGYGAKASAGWTATNEVGNVIEFVSPSAAMSDYRIGIDDASAANTTWYYQYKNARINPTNNTPAKDIKSINKTHSSNGWDLMASQRGLIFIERFFSTLVDGVTTRITYMGHLKSGVPNEGVSNIGFFNIGQSAQLSNNAFLQNGSGYFNISGYANPKIFAASPFVSNGFYFYDTYRVSALDITSALYVSAGGMAVAEIPGLLTNITNDSTQVFVINEQNLESRPVLKVCSGSSEADAAQAFKVASPMLIRLDYWGY